MKFGGFQKTSIIDFPGRISSILFSIGCNLRCPFCYNTNLIDNLKIPFLSEEDVVKILKSRRKYVKDVVITGGEPTMNRELPHFIERLKKEGFGIKLDTNGFFPKTLETALSYLDYVAMDIKTSLEKYLITGAKKTDVLLQSIKLLIGGQVDYEFRNTAVPGIVNKEDVSKMGEMVKGAERFVFQQFVPGENLNKCFNYLKPYSDEVIKGFAEVMSSYVREVELRI